MAKYSLELRDIYNDKNYNLFDFDYPFYDEDLRKEFEELFFQWYMFDEIAFPTPGYFKQRLKARLNLIMPYYIKLYETELEAKKCNFMLNKDLKETFIRELESSANVNSNVTSNGSNSNDSTGIFSDTPQGSISNIEKYMTNANKDNSKSSHNETNNANSENVSNGTEKTELISQGNIGITSSGQLLEDWRKVLININNMILDDLNILFMQVY